MYDYMERIDDMSDTDFQIQLRSLAVFCLTLVQNGTKREMNWLCDQLLSIKNPKRYVAIIETLFTTNQPLYIELLRKGSYEIANRRRTIQQHI
jgi:hypothetical protein